MIVPAVAVTVAMAAGVACAFRARGVSILGVAAAAMAGGRRGRVEIGRDVSAATPPPSACEKGREEAHYLSMTQLAAERHGRWRPGSRTESGAGQNKGAGGRGRSGAFAFSRGGCARTYRDPKIATRQARR